MYWLFYISAAVAIAATIMMVTRLNAVHALLYLIVSLLAVAVIFFLIGAPFVAGLEVIIYAGAIMVLFLFVVMLLNLGQRAIELERALLTPGAWIGPIILAGILGA
jgi:NADH-quinone oxidoreductase subunit J